MFRFTIRDVLWLMVVVAVALAVYFVRPRQTQWEYKAQAFSVGDTTFMNKTGAEGWELTATAQDHSGATHFYFKRPAQPKRGP